MIGDNEFILHFIVLVCAPVLMDDKELPSCDVFGLKQDFLETVILEDPNRISDLVLYFSLCPLWFWSPQVADGISNRVEDSS